MGPSLDDYIDRLERRVPVRAARAMHWVRQPHRVWLRLPLSGLLLLGGAFSFLPVLGIWMIPAGLILLAEDVPSIRSPLARTFFWVETKWGKWRNRRDRSVGKGGHKRGSSR